MPDASLKSFSELLKVLHSIDYSNAVEANQRNNYIYRDRLQLAQASIYDIPYLTMALIGFLSWRSSTYSSFEDSVASLIDRQRLVVRLLLTSTRLKVGLLRSIQNIS